MNRYGLLSFLVVLIAACGSQSNVDGRAATASAGGTSATGGDEDGAAAAGGDGGSAAGVGGAATSSGGDGGDGGGICAPPSKSCDGECVSQDDPSHGCGNDSCAPCVLPNAKAQCMLGECAVASCNEGSDDCNGQPQDGCEADLSLPSHCGQCGGSCAAPTPLCVLEQGGHVCAPDCAVGQSTCGGSCVDTASNVAHCGGCNMPCANSEVCAGGSCQPPTCDWFPTPPTFGISFSNQISMHTTMTPDCAIWIGSPYSVHAFRMTPGNYPVDWGYVQYGIMGLDYDAASGRVIAGAARTINGNPVVALFKLPIAPYGQLEATGVEFPAAGGTGMRIAPAGWGAFGGHAVMTFSNGTIWAGDIVNGTVTLIASTANVYADLQFAGNTLYVADHTNEAIVTVTPNGTVTTVATVSCTLDGLAGLAFDPLGQRLFTACTTGALHQLDLATTTLTPLGVGSGSSGWSKRFLQWDGVNSLIYSDDSLLLKTVEF